MTLIAALCWPLAAQAYTGTPRGNLVWRDQVYATAGPLRLRADVYRPKRFGTQRAVVVLVHGGGWWDGSKSDMAITADKLAALGIVSVSIDYRLSCTAGPVYNPSTFTNNHLRSTPYCGGTHAQAKADVQAAVKWTRANVSSWGGDGSRVSALGVSAGGHLVNELIRKGFNNAAYRMRSTVTWSGPAYLAAMKSTRSMVVPALENTIGCTYASCASTWDSFSLTPAFVAGIARSQVGRLPKMAFSYSSHDASVSGVDSMLTVNRFRHIGAKITAYKTSATCHGFSCGWQHVYGSNTTIAKASIDFLAANG